MADEIIREAIEAFAECESNESDNRSAGLDDLRFARLGGSWQWPDKIKKQRESEGRPCLTINKMPSFIRQVVNDSRQNKPAISVHPVEDGDVKTAEVMSGLIRSIEVQSNADVAWDTAVDNSASTGVGYVGINLDYACDDTFDQDIVIKAKPNRFAIYGDPHSQCADSSDWNLAFEIEQMPEDLFKTKFPGAKQADFSSGSWANGWCDSQEKSARVAAFWKRAEVVKELVQWQAGEMAGVCFKDELKKVQQEYGSLTIAASRTVKSYKVTQYTLTANELLKTVEWPGRYIPIVPVYGEEVNVEGKRHFRSLIRDARDPQQMFNYWRTMATELVALAPKAPWVGRKGAFASDPRWVSANNATHSFLEYDGAEPPMRQPFAGVPVGDLQMALNSSDDMKAVMGLYDASLGARSNETSGKAILARQREGDVSTFHFVDNLSRAIRHTGKILIDLIPHVYNTERVIRTLGVDGKAQTVKLTDGEPDQKANIYNLTMGKYDLTVKAGPSYTTQREEAATMLTELVRANPDSAAILGDIIVENLDIPGGEKAVKRLQAILPPEVKAADDSDDPQAQAMQQALQRQGEQFQQVMQEMQRALQEAQAKAEDNSQKAANDSRKMDVEAYKAVTDRMAQMAQSVAMTPEAIQALVVTTMQDVIATAQDMDGGDDLPDFPMPDMGQPAPMQPEPGQAEEPFAAQ